LNYEEKIVVESYILSHAKGMRPSTTLSLKIDGEVIEEHAQGDGQFDAFMNALAKIYKSKNLELPKLIDYAVRIPPGSSSDALCETIITWINNGKEFKTRGLDSDQTVAAIIATQKMLNVIPTPTIAEGHEDLAKSAHKIKETQPK
jgi:D-citramalate synthase